MEKFDVAIIGGGPAGLGLAARLAALGVKNMVVIDREQQAGGVPRHCGHWGFGWESHRRLMTGPAYAARLCAEAEGIDVRCGTTVLECKSPQVLRLQTVKGISDITAREIVIATGTRESTRAQRLLGGNRVPGVINTGTLQQMVYLKNHVPFRRPVIIGSEWVSFSALMTCRHAGIKPVCMLEEQPRINAPSVFRLGACTWFGVPVRTSTAVTAIRGRSGVEAVEVMRNGKAETIICDGVIVTGKFRPEDALFTAGPMATPQPHVHFTGNVQGDLKTAGRCVAEAQLLAAKIRERLA